MGFFACLPCLPAGRANAQNDDRVLLWVGFFTTCLSSGTSFRMTIYSLCHPEGLQPRRIPCQPISNYHCCAWDSSLTFRMTIIFLCHPESFSSKDPMPTNKQLSLLWMRFFTSFRMTTEKNAPPPVIPKTPARRTGGTSFRMTIFPASS